jgi:hypothetical protein
MAKRIFTVICCLGFLVLAFMDVTAFVEAGRRGVLLFGRNVLPVLFPFFFISGLLVEVGFFSAFGKFGKGAPVFVLSLLSGYPTGARLLCDLYNRGEITRSLAIRTATYTSTCSPIFIIATLGVCFYKSAVFGIIIFAAHCLGALLNGLIYCKVKFNSPAKLTRVRNFSPSSRNDIATAVSNALYSAVQNIFAVGGLIVVFFIATTLIGGGVWVSGILEMTNGVYHASIAAPTSLLIPCAVVSFGGLCVAMQAFVFLGEFRMPLWFYFLYKVTHTILSVLLCFLFFVIFL